MNRIHKVSSSRLLHFYRFLWTTANSSTLTTEYMMARRKKWSNPRSSTDWLPMGNLLKIFLRYNNLPKFLSSSFRRSKCLRFNLVLSEHCDHNSLTNITSFEHELGVRSRVMLLLSVFSIMMNFLIPFNGWRVKENISHVNCLSFYSNASTFSPSGKRKAYQIRQSRMNLSCDIVQYYMCTLHIIFICLLWANVWNEQQPQYQGKNHWMFTIIKYEAPRNGMVIGTSSVNKL